MHGGRWTAANQQEVSAGLLWNAFLQNHGISEYSEVEGTHKDPRVQLLHEWHMQGLNHDFGIISTLLLPAELQVIQSVFWEEHAFLWLTL